MPYTRQLSITEETRSKLINWLDQQLMNQYSERGPYLDDLKSYQRDYWAKPPAENNTFPFLNSSKIIIPLTAIAFEAVHARTMMTLYALPQFVSVKLPEKFEGIDASVERYLDHVFLNSIKVRKQTEPAIMELEKFGTGIARTGYVDERRVAVFEEEDGTEKEVEVIIEQGPTIDSVPNSRYLMPFQSQDPQTAPWCGEEHILTPLQVRQFQDSGFFAKDTIKNLSTWMVGYNSERSADAQQKFENDVDEMQNRVPVLPTELTFQEIWTDFEVKQDGKFRAICVWYHRDSRTIVSLRYNWFRDLRRPHRKGNYIPLEFRWHGVGIAKQNDQFQAEVTTQHRQRIDNGTIANTQMFKVKANSGISINEAIYPGKMWFLDNLDDVQVMPMADVKASSYNNENQAVIFSQQRTGVNDLTLGMPQAGTPGTASDSMARVQESARKFDYTHSNTRSFMNELIQDTVVNLAQFGPRDIEIFEMLPDGPKVEDFFKNPVELFRKSLIFNVELVGQNANRMLDRQSWQQITQMTQTYYTSKMQLAQQSQDPELIKKIVAEALNAADELFRQSLEAFNLRNIDRILKGASNTGEIKQIGAQGSTGLGQEFPMAGSPPTPPQQTPDLSALLSQLQGQQGSAFPSG